MESFYEMTNYFLETVLNPASVTALYETSDLSSWDAIKTSFTEDYGTWLRHYSGYVVCLSLATAYIIFVPLTLILICCCRSCDKCGSGDHPIENKHDTCRRRCCVIYTFLIALMLLVLLAGALVCSVLAFQETRSDAMTKDLRQSIVDVGVFRDETVQEYQDFYKTQTQPFFERVVLEIDAIPRNCSRTVLNQTGIMSLLRDVTTYVAGLNTTINQLQTVANTISWLNNSATQLSQQIQQLQLNMSAELSNCTNGTQSYCDDALSYVNELDVNVDYAAFTDLPLALEMLYNTTSGDCNVYSGLQQSYNEVLHLAVTISRQSNTALSELRNGTDLMNSTLYQFFSATTDVMTSLPLSTAEEFVHSEMSPWIATAGAIIFSVCLFFFLIFLLVVCLLVGALVVGTCCKRALPKSSQESQPRCTRTLASKRLRTALILIALFSWLSMATISVLFLVGGIAHNDVCRYMTNPESYPDDVRTLDDISMQWFNLNISVFDTVASCRKNHTFYAALNVAQFGQEYNVTEVLNLHNYDIPQSLYELTNITYNVSFVVLNHELETTLESIHDAFDLMDFDAYYRALSDNVTTVDLIELQLFMQQTAHALEAVDEQQLADVFSFYEEWIYNMYVNSVEPMENASSYANTSLNIIEDYTLSLDIPEFLMNITVSQELVTSDALSTIMTDIATGLHVEFLAFTTSCNEFVNEDCGQCALVYDAYTESSDAFCVTFLYPFNTYWSLVGLLLIFLILVIPANFKLIDLYNKTDKYAEPYPSFMQMSFHRKAANTNSHPRDQSRSRSNHGNEISEEISMSHLNNPNFTSIRNLGLGATNRSFEQETPDDVTAKSDITSDSDDSKTDVSSSSSDGGFVRYASSARASRRRSVRSVRMEQTAGNLYAPPTPSDYDVAPDHPRLFKFIAFWQEKIEGPLHSVRFTHRRELASGEWRNVTGEFTLH